MILHVKGIAEVIEVREVTTVAPVAVERIWHSRACALGARGSSMSATSYQRRLVSYNESDVTLTVHTGAH